MDNKKKNDNTEKSVSLDVGGASANKGAIIESITEDEAKGSPPDMHAQHVESEFADDNSDDKTHVTQSIVLITVLSLVVLWSFVAYWAISTRNETLERTERFLHRMNVVVDEMAQHRFRMIELGFDVVERWVADHPGVDPRRDPRFTKLVDSFSNELKGSLSFHLADAKGGVLMADGSPMALPSLAGDDFFRAAVSGDTGQYGGLNIGSPIKLGTTEAWKIPVAKRMNAPTGDAKVLVALVDMEKLVSIFELTREHKHGSITLLRSDAVVLARAPFDERVLGRSLVGSTIHRDYLPRSENGYVHVDQSDIEGISKYVSYSKVKEYPLRITAAAADDDVLSSWRWQMWFIVMLAAAVSAIAILAARRLVVTLAALSARTAELQQLATVDALTGIANSYKFMQQFNLEFARAKRYHAPLSLMVLDLDFFKQINEGYGHTVGDEALRSFAREVSACLRSMDVFARLGSEEFSILLLNTSLSEAKNVAERIRTAAVRIVIHTSFGAVRFTTSIGVTEIGTADKSVDAVLVRAERAINSAKAAGRNRVVGVRSTEEKLETK